MATFVEQETLTDMLTNTGKSIMELSSDKSVFLVFLRHFGCVFCKEALTDLAERQDGMKTKNIQLVFVHMGVNGIAEKYFKDFGIKEPIHISDPDRHYYYEFGLRKGTFKQLYGLRTWVRGFGAETQNYKLELSKDLGDSTQMPGIFLLKNGEVLYDYVHKQASDRPNYDELMACCTV